MNRTIYDAARCRDLLERLPRAKRVKRTDGSYTYVLSGLVGDVSVGCVSLYGNWFMWEIDEVDTPREAKRKFVFRLRRIYMRDESHCLPRVGDHKSVLEANTPEAVVVKAKPAGSRSRIAAPSVFGIGDWDELSAQSRVASPRFLQLAPQSQTAGVLPATPVPRRTPSGDVQPPPPAGNGAFAAALFSAGITYSQARTVEAATDAPPPMTKTNFYSIEQPAVARRARGKRNSLLDERTARLKGRIITIQLDGTWSHRRNAPEATVLCFDADTDELIDLQHLVKSRTGDMHTHDDDEDKRLVRYRGASKTMEGEGVECIMKRLHAAGVRVGAVVKDDDSTAMAAVRKYFPDARVSWGDSAL